MDGGHSYFDLIQLNYLKTRDKTSLFLPDLILHDFRYFQKTSGVALLSSSNHRKIQNNPLLNLMTMIFLPAQPKASVIPYLLPQFRPSSAQTRHALWQAHLAHRLAVCAWRKSQVWREESS